MPFREIDIASKIQQAEAKDLMEGIKNKKSYQIETEYSTPLINNLKIKFFKDKEIEEGAGVINLINRIV